MHSVCRPTTNACVIGTTFVFYFGIWRCNGVWRTSLSSLIRHVRRRGSTRRPKAQMPPHQIALVEPVHSQNGGRGHFVLSWVVPTRRTYPILYRQDDGYVSYFRNTKANPGGRLHCTSAFGAILQNPFSLERFTSDGVPHVTVEGRHGYPHQSALSALWRQTEISAYS